MDLSTSTVSTIVTDGVGTVLGTLGGALPVIFGVFALLIAVGLAIFYFRRWIGSRKG